MLPLDRAREALARVVGRHTRGKIVLQIGQEQPGFSELNWHFTVMK